MLIAIAMLLAACAQPSGDDNNVLQPLGFADVESLGPLAEFNFAPAPRLVNGISQLASVSGEEFSVHTASGDLTFLSGVNLGSTIPGRSPGELAITAEIYREWFPEIAASGFRVIRVYTILPPHFYDEFAAYNRNNPDQALYLAHGIWIPEEDFYDVRDVWDPLVDDAFHAEIEDAIGAVHGDRTIAPRPGHASGTFTTDVSEWLISWIMGVELDPHLVVESDAKNTGRTFEGELFGATPDATPTEAWLAKGIDQAARLQLERGRLVPFAFVNWPSTDPLAHPEEPLVTEDLVSVDANHVMPTENWKGGYFASYHAYPYYPDFQRYEPGIADFELNGSLDPYAGYLTKLREHHAGMPVMVTEFGVPSGLGSAHNGPLGRNQGGHSEFDQMRINAELMQVVADVGVSGGYVFEWLDEWFKFTWNTIDFELPGDRRAMWMNPLTNEAHFGVIAAEPGTAPRVLIDGQNDEWDEAPVIHESDSAIRAVRALHDEGYLYLSITFDEVDMWESEEIVIGFDVIGGGAGHLPNRRADERSDYAIVFNPSDPDLQLAQDETAVVAAAGHSDPYRRLYGGSFNYLDLNKNDLATGTGSWEPQRLLVNHPLTHPLTGQLLGPESIVAGKLERGTSRPDAEDFYSLAGWEGNEHHLEVRVPHQLIGFSDPSSLQASVIDLDGTIRTETVDRIGIVVSTDEALANTTGYAWEQWQTVTWHQRPKHGVELLAEASASTLLDGIKSPVLETGAAPTPGGT